METPITDAAIEIAAKESGKQGNERALARRIQDAIDQQTAELQQRVRESLLEILRTNHNPSHTPFQVEQMFHKLVHSVIQDLDRK